MSWEMLRGIPGILKVVTLVFGLICVVFLAFVCSRPYEPVAWYNTSEGGKQPTWNKDYEEAQMHVVEDEFCLSIIIIIFFASVAWFVIHILDKPLKETDLRKKIDMIYHFCAGGLIGIMGIMWFVTVGGRTISMKTYNASSFGDEDAMKTVAAAYEKFGYFNLVFHDITFKDSAMSFHGIPLYPHRYDGGRFISLIIVGLLIMLNAGMYLLVSVFLFFNKGVRVIQRNFEIPKVKISPMFKERNTILKLLTIVFGIFATILSGTSYASSFYLQMEPMMKFEFEVIHSYGEEISFAIVAIFLGLSIIWLILVILNIIKDTPLRKKIDMFYHLVGGFWVFLAVILWAVFVSLRVFDYTEFTTDSFDMANAKMRAGYENVIVINAPGRAMSRAVQYVHSTDEMKFLHVVFAWIFILLDCLAYLVLAFLLIRSYRKNRVQPDDTFSDGNNNAEPISEPATPATPATPAAQ